jgi:lipopolysaccharide heptosyltransferase I
VTRVLIVRLGSLGDVIHGIPVAAALRERHPAARIDWVTDPRYVELLAMVPAVDRAVPLDTRRLAALTAIVREARRNRYDAAIDLQGLLKSAVLARACGAERTIGFPAGHLREPAARFFYTQTPDPGAAAHVIAKNLALAAALGADPSRITFPVRIPSSAVADRIASTAGSGGYVLVNPGAAWPNKRWPPERFGAVAASVRERHGMRAIVLWGPGEEALAAAVAAAARGAADVAPQTTITDLAAIAARARLMLSGDTGPLHVAAAVGTPIVALFGPTWPERNGPWSTADVTLSRNADCVCHYERRCRRARACIEDIDVDEVLAAIDRRLAVQSEASG